MGGQEATKMNREFAELVEELRVKSGLSQTALAVLAWPEKATGKTHWSNING